MIISLLKKELYIQARNWKIRVFGSFYILFLTVLAFSLIWYISTGSASYDPGRGLNLFLAFIIFLAILTFLVSPAFTFNSISLEKEQNTFYQLKLTWLKPYQIIMGKAGLSFIFILVLLSLSLPVIILMTLFGGKTLIQIIRLYFIILTIAFAFSMIGLMCSSIFKNSRYSGYATYSITGLFIFAPELIPLILTQIFKANPQNPAFTIPKIINPIRAILNSLNTDMQYQVFGISSLYIAVAVYILLSIMAISMTLYGIRNRS